MADKGNSPRTRRYNAAAERQENVIGRKIAEARKRSGYSLVAFGELLEEYGLSVRRSGINKWETGAAVPNAYQLLAVCRALNIREGLGYFTGSAPAPALNQEGMRKLEEYRKDLIASGRYRPRSERSGIRYLEMPVSTLAASAGPGAFLDEGCFELVSFPAHTIPDQADFGVRVSGDSMEPVYQDGQIVWIQSCQSLNPGDVGLFIYDGSGYIKVYGEQEPEDPELFLDSGGVLHRQPVLLSYNKAYPPRPVNPELGFSIAGRVLNYTRI